MRAPILSETVSIHAGQVAFLRLDCAEPSFGVVQTRPEEYLDGAVDKRGVSSIDDVENRVSVGFEAKSEVQACVAVLLAPLTSTLQPEHLGVDGTGYAQVFFTPSQNVGSRGSVTLDAPIGFDFGENCTVLDLSSEYHVRVTTLLLVTPFLDSYTGSRYPASAPTFSRATLRVGGAIYATLFETTTSYGFQI